MKRWRERCSLVCGVMAAVFLSAMLLITVADVTLRARDQPADPRGLRTGRTVSRRNVLSRAAVRVPARREYRGQRDRRPCAAAGASAQARGGVAGGCHPRGDGLAGADRGARQPRIQRRHGGSGAAEVLALAGAADRRDRRGHRGARHGVARARTRDEHRGHRRARRRLAAGPDLPARADRGCARDLGPRSATPRSTAGRGR